MAGAKKERRPRRSFTDEFKAEVVKRVLSGTKTAGQVARELDLTETAVRAWVKQAKIDSGKSPTGALTSSEREELTRLRRENRELKEDREILKKAAAHSTGRCITMQSTEVNGGRSSRTKIERVQRRGAIASLGALDRRGVAERHRPSAG